MKRAIVLGLIALTACTNQQAAQTQSNISTQTQKSVNDVHQALANAHVNDAQLKVRVTAAIAAQTGVNVFHITTDVKDGVVTLTGTVPTKPIEQTVVKAAAGVAGVTRVVDRLSAEQ